MSNRKMKEIEEQTEMGDVEELHGKGKAERELQGQAAAARADAGRNEPGEEFPGQQMRLHAVKFVAPFSDDTLAFERRWYMQSLIMGAQNLLALRERQFNEAKDSLEDAKRERADRQEIRDWEMRCSEAESGADMCQFHIKELKRAYFDVMKTAWQEPRRRGEVRRPRFSTVENRRDYDRRDDRDRGGYREREEDRRESRRNERRDGYDDYQDVDRRDRR